MGWFDNNVVKPAKKQWTDTKNSVEDTANKVGDLIDDTLGNVGKTVDQILKDPKSLAILALNVYTGGAGLAIGSAMGVTNAMAAEFIGNVVLNTAVNGGDVNAAAKSAAFQLGGTELAKTVTAGLADATISTATKQVIANTTSAAGIAIIKGKDPMAAIAAGGVAAGVNLITSQYAGFDKLPVASQQAIKTTLKGALTGKDPTKDLVYGAIGSGMQAYKNVSDGNAATKKELGRDLTDEEATKLALYSSGNTLKTDIKNLVVGEKSTKAIESGQSSYTYDGKPVAVSGNDLNNYFKGKLTNAGLTPTAADISAASTAYGKSKDAAGATNAVVDSRTLNEKEVKDIYAKEGVTNPTADMIAKYVKSNVDAATVAADAQKEIDANSTNLDESTAYLKSILGRNPNAREAAAFIGNKPEEANLTRDNVYTTLVDLLTNPQNNPVKAGPGVDVAATYGAIYNATDKEIADLKAKGIDLPKINDSWSPVMQSPEDNVMQDVKVYGNRKLDPLEDVQLDVLLALTERNPVFKEELRDVDNAFEKQGYVPTIEELLNIVNQTNGKPKEETKTAVTNYVNANKTLGTSQKPLTQADIDFMTQIVAGKAPVDTRYDVTGDKKVTQEDIDYLTKYLGTGTGTGAFKPNVGSYWAPTGLYGKLYEQELARAADKAAADKAAAAQKIALAKQGTQTSANAFNQLAEQNAQMVRLIPTLADVHFYGKDFGTQRQKLTPEGELVAPKPAQVAQDNVSGENDVSSLLQQLMAQGDSASESDLKNIVGGNYG
jgi:hypothetical protein